MSEDLIEDPTPGTPSVGPQALSGGVRPSWAEKTGGTCERILAPPRGICGIVIGYTNSGKSTFLQDMPNSLFINLDQSSVVAPYPQAVVWPFKGRDGFLYSTPDTKMTAFTFAEVNTRLDTVIKLAREGKPHPTTVCLDSLTPLIRMLQEWVPTAYRWNTYGGEEPTWDNIINSQGAWDKVYAAIADIPRKLASAGIGCWLVLHLDDEETSDSKGVVTRSPVITATTKLRRRIFPQAEFIGVIGKSSYTTKEQQPRSLGGGRTGTTPVTVTKTRYTIQQPPASLRSSKLRVKLPGVIELGDRPWRAFEKIYNEAREAQMSPVETPDT